jgi:hypothetical protein
MAKVSANPSLSEHKSLGSFSLQRLFKNIKPLSSTKQTDYNCHTLGTKGVNFRGTTLICRDLAIPAS